MLHWASLSNQWETVEMLLKEFKAEVDCLTLDEVTPLMLAASHGHKKVIRILLDHGADIKKKKTTNIIMQDLEPFVLLFEKYWLIMILVKIFIF